MLHRFFTLQRRGRAAPQSDRGEGGSRRSGQWGMTRARALHTAPWVQSVFAPRSGLLLWRPTTFPGSALDELTFCRVEVGEIASVAVGGDVRPDDVEESLCTGEAAARANAAKRFPHDAWDAEPGLIGVACRV